MARAGPRKVSRYGDQFKATAVKLSNLSGVLIQDVAHALDVHTKAELKRSPSIGLRSCNIAIRAR